MDSNQEAVRSAIAEVLEEITLARARFGPFNSDHEGYAVILEELDELWEAVRVKGHTRADKRAEARQVAAMAILFMAERVG